MAVPATQIGPRDMIRADGSYDWAALKLLARRRAAAGVEVRTSLRHYRSLAKDLFEAHPANRSRVQFHSITAFGRPAEGLRYSTF